MERKTLVKKAALMKRMCALIIQKTNSNLRFAFPEDEKTNSLFEGIVSRVEELYGAVTDQRLADIAIYIEYVYRSGNGRRRFVGFLTQIPMKYNCSVLEFYQRRKYAMTKFEDAWLRDNGLSRMAISDQVAVAEKPSAVPTNHEDSARRRFINTPTGYVYCHKLTSGWDPMSTVCVGCRFCEQCKTDLLRSRPDLYNKRHELSG